ncbi:hypothetical protein [Kocuria nitroreducens]|uniref:hypothetical protein n=1 Tax=Kocuria nitroreducens TaxID=3058914 RepID=UPI0036D8662B
MRQYRTPTAYVLGVLVLLAAIVLTTPNGGTQARWSASAQAAVPALTTGRVGFEVGGVQDSATLTNTSGFGVRYRPLQVALLDSSGGSVAPPQGMRFAYRAGADCAAAESPAQWTAVAPGGPAPVAVGGGTWAPLDRDRPAGMCLTVSTDAVAEDALRPLDGQVLQVVTQVEAASLGDGTWSTTRSWTAPFTVELPAVEQPPVEQPPATAAARPVVQDAAQCGADKSAALLRWEWTERSGVPAVTEWQIWVRPAGTTGAPTQVQTVRDGAARTAQVTASDLLKPSHLRPSQDHEVLVRAVFATGGTPHVDSAYAWRIKTPGGSGHINCEGLPS